LTFANWSQRQNFSPTGLDIHRRIKAEAINQAAALLAAEQHERHRRVVFVLDEAHLLSPEQLEELRLLSNAELDSASPFAGILLGQPTLAVRLRQGVFAAYVAPTIMSRRASMA